MDVSRNRIDNKSTPDEPASPSITGDVISISPIEIVGSIRSAAPTGICRVSLHVNDAEVDSVDLPPSADGCRSFRFAIRDLWDYCGPADSVSVRANGVRLRMPSGGPGFTPTGMASMRSWINSPAE